MKRLRALRLERGWSAFELSRRSRVNAPDLSALECGRKTPPPDSVVLRRLARALRYEGDPADLLAELPDGKTAVV